MTAPTVAALAREIADVIVSKQELNGITRSVTESVCLDILTRALPVGRAVEITVDDVIEAQRAYYDGGSICNKWAGKMADTINARLRARAPQSDTVECRVVRRKTTTVRGKLVVPETGMYVKRYANSGGCSTSAGQYNKGEEMIDTFSAIRRIDTDAPTTWITRTTTEVPQDWTAGMLPKQGQLFVCVTTDGDPQLARYDRVAHTLDWFNRHIVAFYPLSEDLP